MTTNYVTNANRPTLAAAYPIAGGGDADGCGNKGIRKTGTSKLKIPKGPLVGFIGAWLNPNGVMRTLLNHVVTHAAVVARLAHENEMTTKDRQIQVEGYNKIAPRTTEAHLDTIAVDLLSRAFPETTAALAGGDDAILTYYGFRAAGGAPATQRTAFVDRLVALQLIIRRGMEIRIDMGAANIPDDKFPLFAITIEAYNENDWDAILASAEPPGTTTKQPLDPEQQDAAAALRAGHPPIMGSLTETDGRGDARQLEAMMATIDKLSREAADNRTEIQTLKKRRIDGTQGSPIEPARPAPFLPTHAIPSSNEPNVTQNLDDVGATKILNQPEIDPADSVDLGVTPEIVIKYKAFHTITAEYIHGVTCQLGQTAGFEMSQAADGTHKIVAGISSTRKIMSIWELHAITTKLIDSISSVHPTVGLKIRAQLPDAIFRAYRNFKSNLSKTVMYWNRHVNEWIQGMRTGTNKSLKYSQGIATMVGEDHDMSTHEAADVDRAKSAFTDMRNEIKNLRRQIQGGGGGGGSYKGSPTKPPGANDPKQRTATRSDESTKQQCANHLAGRPCAILDKDDGKCIFAHTGERGSNPEAARSRFTRTD